MTTLRILHVLTEPTASQVVGFPRVYWRRVVSRVPLGVEFVVAKRSFLLRAASGGKAGSSSDIDKTTRMTLREMQPVRIEDGGDRSD